MKQGWVYCKLVLPIIDLLRQGITPEKIALSIAFGIGLGVFPMLGSTTILCALAAMVFGLNLPAIQLVNYFVYPLQLILLIPFFRLGEVLFRAPHTPLSIPMIFASIRASAWQATKTYWTVGWHAMVAWLLIGPLAIWLLSVLLAPVLRKLATTSEALMHRQPAAEA